MIICAECESSNVHPFMYGDYSCNDCDHVGNYLVEQNQQKDAEIQRLRKALDVIANGVVPLRSWAVFYNTPTHVADIQDYAKQALSKGKEEKQ